MKLDYEEISKRAFDIWVEEGKPEGRELEHWLQAEQEFRSKKEKSNRRAKVREKVS